MFIFSLENEVRDEKYIVHDGSFLGETGVPKSLKTIYDLMNQTKTKSKEKFLEKRKGANHNEKNVKIERSKRPLEVKLQFYLL